MDTINTMGKSLTKYNDQTLPPLELIRCVLLRIYSLLKNREVSELQIQPRL